MENKHKDEKISELLRRLISEYIGRESNRTSLITVTKIDVSDKFDRATVLISVLPETYESAAITFLIRNVDDIRDFIRERSRLGRVPFFTFSIDGGEKNRQRIDEIERSLK